MPELRHDLAARSVHVVDYLPPSGLSSGSVEVGDVGVVDSSLVIDRDAFGDDQSGAALSSSAVVVGNVAAGHTFDGVRARHRRHDYAVGQFERTDAERLEQRVGHFVTALS